MALVSGPDVADLDRQKAWRERSVERIKARRQNRLKTLADERQAIQRAVQAYDQLDSAEEPGILLRRGFIALERPRRVLADGDEPRPTTALERAREVASRPPLARLVHRESNALALYLTAILVAHLETKPGHVFHNKRNNVRTADDGSRSWALLAGLSTPPQPRSKHARVRRALNELVTAGLAAIKPASARQRFEGWAVLQDDGSDSVYRRPGESDGRALFVSIAFFLHGWHLVLTQGEIAVLFAIMEMSRSPAAQIDTGGNRWISLPQSVRARTYGLSNEVYFHVHELVEFGLVNLRDPMPGRRRGKISERRTRLLSPPSQGEPQPLAPLPYQFSVPGWTAFGRDAPSVVNQALTTLPLPYRLDDNGSFFAGPQELMEAYRVFSAQEKPSR